MPTSRHEECLQAVATAIAAMTLTGIAAGNRIVRTVATILPTELPATPFPCIISSLPAGLGEAVVNDTATNLAYEIDYPVQIVIVDDANRSNDNATDRNARLLWRDEIQDALHLTRLSGITAEHYVTCEPKPVLLPAEWEQGKWVAGFLVHCICRVAI